MQTFMPPLNPADITSALNDFVQGRSGVGIIAGVVDNGRVQVYGAGNLGRNAPKLDESTEFQIGSITKTFTATLLAVMVRDGDVKLNDPIQKYLPRDVRAPQFEDQSITLANLAEQNSGLPRLPTNMAPRDPSDPYDDYTPAMLYDFLKGYTLPNAPGSQYDYSNLGVGLLGDLLARAAKTSYENVLQRRVLKPLGMYDTSTIPNAVMQMHLAPGHDASVRVAPPWHFGELAAAGALYSNMHDMLRFLQANLATSKGPLVRVMAFAQQPRAVGQFEKIARVGLVWEIDIPLGITWHNGETGGYHGFIGFNREQHSGIVVLANIADSNVDTVALHILAPQSVAAPSNPSVTQAIGSANEDPLITARIKALYNSYVSGNVDTSSMTPEFAKLFTPSFIAQLQTSTKELGPPREWAFAAGTPEGNAVRYDYRVTFSDAVRTFSVWIGRDGKIAGSRLSQ